jgi:hypothetical protein
MANESRTYGRDRLSFSQDQPLNLNVEPASPPGPGSRNPGESGSNPRLSGLLHRPVSKSNYPRLSGLLHRPVSKLRSSHVRTSHGRSEHRAKRSSLINAKYPPVLEFRNSTIGEGNGGKKGRVARASSTRSTADAIFASAQCIVGAVACGTAALDNNAASGILGSIWGRRGGGNCAGDPDRLR